MALVNVANMIVLDNPAPFENPLQFEITFECLQALEDDLEWKVVYVGSAESSSHDQTLDEILVGPVPVGINKFILQADAPDPSTIPQNDILGVTVILVTCSYREREFVRVGYYVNNEYSEPYDEEKGPPMPLDMSKVTRTILADKPRVTRFVINWGDLQQEGQQQQQQEQQHQQQQQFQQQQNTPMLPNGAAMSIQGFGTLPQDVPTDTAMITSE
jgi:histone chaperone ASF1